MFSILLHYVLIKFYISRNLLYFQGMKFYR